MDRIPAKMVLYCEYPGAEFRKEFDASKFDFSGIDYGPVRAGGSQKDFNLFIY